MKIVEKCPTIEQFDRIVNRWKEQLMKCQTDTNELVFRLRDFVQTELDINRIKSNRWIPCSERLPKIDEDVLIYLRQPTWTENPLQVAHLLYDGITFELSDGEFDFPLSRVSHWQYLPEPPEKE